MDVYFDNVERHVIEPLSNGRIVVEYRDSIIAANPLSFSRDGARFLGLRRKTLFSFLGRTLGDASRAFVPTLFLRFHRHNQDGIAQ